ncbi:MAG: DUF883 family protein [Cellvibrionales bacterium]|jgi:ElaB/YqjD/DUF883 family membrane-anchored ribosome-binding protein|nr:DUF883 family protein [Cellvibrionales bacterium]
MTQRTTPPPEAVSPSGPAQSPGQDALQDELQALIGDAEKLLQHAASLAGEQADALRNAIQRNLQRARETLGSGEDAIREQAIEMQRAGESYVKANPLQALGVAVGIGVLIGLLLGHRHHDK